MRKPSAYSAVGLLDQQAKGHLRLSDELFDACFDVITEMLERANNQKGAAFTRYPPREFDQDGVETTADDAEKTELVYPQAPLAPRDQS